MTTETKIDGMTAEQHRAAASEAYGRADESFERSDTDGFVTQWAAGLTGNLHRRKAEIAENGGKAQFVCLADAETGEVVPSKWVDTRYGSKRVTLDADGKFDVWVGARTARGLAKHGFTEVWVEHPATAVMGGSGHGLSGTAYVVTKSVCGECGTFLQAIGFRCSCGHVTPATVTGPYVEEA